MKVALTGKPGIGKTTICRKVAKRYDGEVGGTLCGEVRRDGRRIGFEIEDLATGETGWLAKKDAPGPSVGSYGVQLDDLEEIGVTAIRNALDDADLVVIDEVGPMELKSDTFVETVEDALNSDRDLLLVVHQKSNHPVVRRARDEAEILTVTKENRDRLPGQILDLLR